MRTGFIVKLVLAMLLLVALLPKSCAQVMLPHRHVIEGASGTTMVLTNWLVGFWNMNESGSVTRVSIATTIVTQDLYVPSPGHTTPSTNGFVNNAAFMNSTDQGELNSNGPQTNVSVADFQPFTFTCWVYLDNTNADRTVLHKGVNLAANNEYDLRYRKASNNWTFLLNTNGPILASSQTPPTLTAWHWLAAWRDVGSNLVCLSVDNQQEDAVAFNFQVKPEANELEVGTFSPNFQFLEGRIDELGLWFTNLTATQRTYIYTNGLAGKEFPFTP